MPFQDGGRLLHVVHLHDQHRPIRAAFVGRRRRGDAELGVVEQDQAGLAADVPVGVAGQHLDRLDADQLAQHALLHKVGTGSRRAVAGRLSEEVGLSLWEFAVLAAPADFGASAQREVGDRLGLDPSDMVRLMDGLTRSARPARARPKRRGNRTRETAEAPHELDARGRRVSGGRGR